MDEEPYRDKTIDRKRNIHDGNFLNYLSSAYGVLRKIFSYLSLEDLQNACKAFESWKSVADTIKKERTNIQSFVVYPNSQKCDYWSEASFALTFSIFRNGDIEERLKRFLSNESQFLLVESRAGLIGTDSDFSCVIQQPNSNFVKPRPSVEYPTVHLRIPTMPGVGVRAFTWRKNISFEDFRNSFSIPDNQKIKCLLILMTVQDNYRESSEQKDDFISYLKTVQVEDFAVGGCLIDQCIEESEDESSESITKYVVFYGDNVEAASVVLGRNVITKKGIEDAVYELKEISPRTKKGLIFVFRCCSRQEASRQPKSRKHIIQWEGDSISSNFPTTPVIGCFGYGEFGRKYPDSGTSKPPNKRKKESNIWEYSFSTSIVYVGFNA